jgi:hypothetical protein
VFVVGPWVDAKSIQRMTCSDKKSQTIMFTGS